MPDFSSERRKLIVGRQLHDGRERPASQALTRAVASTSTRLGEVDVLFL